MKIKKLLLATVASFAYLLLVNALIFPLVFPEGPPERFVNQREKPLLQYHALALLVTSFLMSYLYPLIYRGGAVWKED